MSEAPQATSEPTAEPPPSEPEDPPRPAAAHEPKPIPDPRASFNPVIVQHSVRRFEFLHRRPAIEADVALVFATVRKGLKEFRPGHVPTMGELLWSGIRTVYEIDMGLHKANISADLPSANEAFAFHAEIDCHWRVQDPRQIVIDGIRDVRSVLSPILLDHLRNITRRYPIEQAADAEAAANQKLRGAHLGLEFGVQVRPFVRLVMDSHTREHAENVRGVERYREIIAAGDTDQFALLLHQNRNDSDKVLRALNEERDSNRRQTIDFVNKLIESGAIDRWEIDEQVRAVLDWLKESADRIIKPVDQIRPVAMGGPKVVHVRPVAGDGATAGNGTTRPEYDSG